MKAAILAAKGKLVVQDVPTPSPGPGQVLVEVICCGICGSDLHLFDMDGVPQGVIMGHEWVASIAELGPGVSGWRVGERVVMGNYSRAGVAMSRQAGTLATDPLAFFAAHPAVRAGGYGQYLVWDADALHAVPDLVSDEAAAMADTFAVALGSVVHAQIGCGNSVLIIGAGPIGLAVLMCLPLQSPGRVCLSEINPARAELAVALGADPVLDPRDARVSETLLSLTGGGPDAIIDCVGSPQTIQQSVDWIRFGGRVVLVGITTQPVEILPLQWIGKGLDFQVYHQGPVAPVMELFNKGKLKPEELITDRVPLQNIQTAFLDLQQPTYQVKTLVYPRW